MRRLVSSFMVAAMLILALAVPALGEAKTYRVVAGICYDGGGQFLDARWGGSMADVRQWINMQRKGGPTDVMDGICETWTGVYTIYQLVDGQWVVFQDKT